MKPIQYNVGNKIFWVRFFGKGFCVKNILLHPLIFSGRNEYVRGFKFFNWYIKFLK